MVYAAFMEGQLGVVLGARQHHADAHRRGPRVAYEEGVKGAPRGCWGCTAFPRVGTILSEHQLVTIMSNFSNYTYVSPHQSSPEHTSPSTGPPQGRHVRHPHARLAEF